MNSNTKLSARRRMMKADMGKGRMMNEREEKAEIGI